MGLFVYHLAGAPELVGLNYRVYHVAAETLLAGGDVYAVSPADSSFQYLYPPVTVLAFVPLAAVGSWVPGFLVLTAVSLAASVWAGVLLSRYVASLGYTVSRRERALIVVFLALSPQAELSLVYGQVNHIVVAGLVVGLVLLARDRGRIAGAVLAVPAYLKILPGVVGLYLLRRRAWPAIAAAVGTAAGLTALGVAVLGVDRHLTYVTDVLLPRREMAAFAGGLDPSATYVTLRRPLSVLFPTVDPVWYGVGAGTILLPVLAVLYRRVESHTDRLVAIHGTLLSGLLVFPSLLLYYAFAAFSLVALLYDLPGGRARQLFVAGACLANLSLSFQGLQRLLAALPVGASTAEGVGALLRPVFTLGTPVLYGSLLMLAGCLLYCHDRGTRPESTPR